MKSYNGQDQIDFRLFLVSAGANQGQVIRAVVTHLGVAEETALLLLEEAPGYIRRFSGSRPSEFFQCRCYSARSVLSTGRDSDQRSLRSEDFAVFDSDGANRFAADLRAAGASVVVVDPAW